MKIGDKVFPMNRKPCSDSTLKRMTKGTLIEYIRCLEHNYENLYLAYNAAVDANLKKFKDYEKVTRCKDCKSLRLTGTVRKCQNGLVMMLCEPNDYCSRAARKEE